MGFGPDLAWPPHTVVGRRKSITTLLPSRAERPAGDRGNGLAPSAGAGGEEARRAKRGELVTAPRTREEEIHLCAPPGRPGGRRRPTKTTIKPNRICHLSRGPRRWTRPLTGPAPWQAPPPGRSRELAPTHLPSSPPALGGSPLSHLRARSAADGRSRESSLPPRRPG